MEHFFILRDICTTSEILKKHLMKIGKIVKYGIATISYRTPFLWANLPNEYQLETSLHYFKLKIKHWHCDKCV